MTPAKFWLTIGGAVLGLAAAGLWGWATIVKVKPPPPQTPQKGWTGATITVGDHTDLIPTLLLQGKWNGRAAAVTAIAILVQTAANLVS